MNCKLGDRAIIVHGMPLNMGRVVRVVELLPDSPIGHTYTLNGELWRKSTPGRTWICESLSGHFASKQGRSRRMVRPIRDAYLMPLPPESECLDKETSTTKDKEHAHD